MLRLSQWLPALRYSRTVTRHGTFGLVRHTNARQGKHVVRTMAPARACLAIPAVLRRRCGLRAGDRVLLAAVPGQDMLAAYSFAVVDQAIRAHGAFPHAPGVQP